MEINRWWRNIELKWDKPSKRKCYKKRSSTILTPQTIVSRFNCWWKFMKEGEEWKSPNIQHGDYDTPIKFHYHLTMDLGILSLLGAAALSFLSCWYSWYQCVLLSTPWVGRTHSGLLRQQIKLSPFGVCYLKKPQSRKSKKVREPTHSATENRDT